MSFFETSLRPNQFYWDFLLVIVEIRIANLTLMSEIKLVGDIFCKLSEMNM